MINQKIVLSTTYWYEELGKEQEHKEISDLTIVSRDEQLNPLSFFYDNKWDLKSYSKQFKKSIINFSRLDSKLIRDAKIIMYMVLMYGRSRFGRQLDAKTVIAQYFNNCVVPISKWIEKRDITFSLFFQNPDNSFQFVKEHVHTNIQHIIPFFRIFANIKNEHFYFSVNISKDTIKLLSEIRTVKEQSKKQTPVIPTRILSNALKSRWEHIDFIQDYVENICDFIQDYMRTKNHYGKTTPLFLSAVSKVSLDELAVKYKLKNKIDFCSFIVKLQSTCINLIHAYSGMRLQEAYSLNVNSFESTKEHFVLHGYTTKLEGSRKKTHWITSGKIEAIFKILKAINKSMASELGLADDELPLLTTTLLIFNPKYKQSITPQLSPNNELEIESQLITIQEADLKELEAIEPFRDWREEKKFTIGSKWHFASHQYRRSLAVYSMQSGIVDIGSLKMQLKHLFQEMSMYYAKGSGHSSNILYEKELVKNFKKTGYELQSLEYIRDVIFSDSELLGTHGKYVEENKKNVTDNMKEYILNDRKKTLTMFKNGDIAYKDTALGGCVSVEPCDSYLTNSLVACINCESGIIKKEKLNNIINKQSLFIEKLNPDSVEYRTEKEELEILIKHNKRITGEQN